MLASKRLELRRSEIRQNLAELANIETPSEDEVRKMGDLDAEYRAKEVQYRAALVSEDEERREAGAELETRDGKEYEDLVSRFEVRQVLLNMDTGQALEGATAEVVQEMRSKGRFTGTPVPMEALEVRAGETVSSGTPDPRTTRPIVDRLFANSVATRMGVAVVNIGVGETEWPLVTNGASAGWAASENANVPGPSALTAEDKALKPDHTLGGHVRVTRKALAQSGAGLEQAIRRDLGNVMRVELDRAVFQGSGASGEPLGIITGQSTYGIGTTAIDAAASYAAFRDVLTTFINANAIEGPSGVKLMIRPELWAALDDAFITGTSDTEWDRLTRRFGAANIVLATNALAAPAGGPPVESDALLTCNAGIAPAFLGVWGGIDLIRDVYSGAQSGELRITALQTVDMQVPRATGLHVLTGLQ
jgi:HK97 family phage major capsid protein